MTVLKDNAKEADALSKMAISLAKGEQPTTTVTARDDKGNRDVASILLTPQSIFKDNVKDAVGANGVTVSLLCTGANAAACTAAGIS